MSPVSQPGARCESIALSRQTLVNILIHNMGWEAEDLVVFWRLARREQRDPGCLDREFRADMESIKF